MPVFSDSSQRARCTQQSFSFSKCDLPSLLLHLLSETSSPVTDLLCFFASRCTHQSFSSLPAERHSLTPLLRKPSLLAIDHPHTCCHCCNTTLVSTFSTFVFQLCLFCCVFVDCPASLLLLASSPPHLHNFATLAHGTDTHLSWLLSFLSEISLPVQAPSLAFAHSLFSCKQSSCVTSD